MVLVSLFKGSSVTSGGIDAGTGYTILSEKTLFLGQKVGMGAVAIFCHSKSMSLHGFRI